MRHPLLQKYDRLIEFFGQMLGQDYELSLFDLRAEGCPLIFIAGGMNSGRPLGTPLAAAGLSMLERFRQGDREPLVNSHSVTADGRLLRSSAVILADGDDEPEGLLSVRFDDNRYRDLVDEVLHLCHPDHFWQEIEGLEIAGLNRPSDSGQASAALDGELTAAEAVRRMLLEANTTADALTSEERLHIISELEKHGYFRLKGAVREVTEVLHCSQASVYRYLTERLSCLFCQGQNAAGDCARPACAEGTPQACLLPLFRSELSGSVHRCPYRRTGRSGPYPVG